MRSLVQIQVGPPPKSPAPQGIILIRRLNDLEILSCAHRVHISGGVGCLEAICSCLVETLKEVFVGVEGGLDRCMTEPFLDDLRMLPLGDEDGSM